MPLIPTPYSVAHIPRALSGGIDPDTGNPTLVAQTPITRLVQSITQFGRRGSSHEVISPDYLQRTETILHLAVPDPTLYAEHDQVMIGAQFDSSNTYVPNTGVAYWIDGTPSDDRQGPWPSYLAQFGGLLKLRRVT